MREQLGLPPRQTEATVRYNRAERDKIEERFIALELASQGLADENKRLRGLIRRGKAFTVNPHSLVTDLQDIGSV
ncbi:hypothetical protein LCGC14_2887960, partial [marine sediment metagenome]